jgi:hypothetical protein
MDLFVSDLANPHNNTPTPIKKIPNPIGPDHQSTTDSLFMLKFSFQEFYPYVSGFCSRLGIGLPLQIDRFTLAYFDFENFFREDL